MTAAELAPPVSTGIDRYDVLVVDDNLPFGELLTDYLRHHGYRVLGAPDGRRAIALLRDCRVSLVLTDILMPEADGMELIMHLRTTPDRPEILAMSGDGRGDAKLFLTTARHLGARRVLTKPFALSALLTDVRELIGAPAPR